MYLHEKRMYSILAIKDKKEDENLRIAQRVLHFSAIHFLWVIVL